MTGKTTAAAAVTSVTRPKSTEFIRSVPTTPKGFDPVNSAVTVCRDPSLYSTPRDSQDKCNNLYDKLRNCHTVSAERPSSFNEHPRYEPPPYREHPRYEPPVKRSRPSSVITQPSDPNDEMNNLFPRRSSQSQSSLPRAPRQVTLDGLRNWKLPGSVFAKTNSIQSSPRPMRRNQSSDDMSTTNARQQSNKEVNNTFNNFPIIVPDSVKTVLNKRVDMSIPQHQDTLGLKRSISSCAPFRTINSSNDAENINK